MRDVGRRACQAHWPEAGAQLSTSTGASVSNEAKEIPHPTPEFSPGSPDLASPLWALSQVKNPHMFSEAESRTRPGVLAPLLVASRQFFFPAV